MIPLDEYKKIIASIPILCVDIVLRNSAGKFLLGRRTNEPLQGELWVIGGRVLKGERAEAAARRKLREELALELDELELLGVYEDFFDKNSLGVDTLYHTVSLVFGGRIDESAGIRLDQQHTAWTFADALPERLVIKPLSGAVSGAASNRIGAV